MKKKSIFTFFLLICLGCQDEQLPQKTPAIESISVSDITESSAKCTFSIVPIGATQKAGVIYGLDPSLQSGVGSLARFVVNSSDVSLTMSSLLSDTTYYYKTYITDNKGTFIYSEIGQFRTKILQILNVSTSIINVPYMEGSQKFNITSNIAWSINSDQIWCTVQPSTGDRNREITVSVTENTTNKHRTAFLTISAGSKSVQVEIDQYTKVSTEFGNDITASESFGGGDGTEESPYLIINARHLKKIVDNVNKGNSFYNTFFKLMTDIQITADEWIPIGTYGYTNDDPNYNSIFQGIFDGGGHTISGTMKSNQFKIFGFIGYAFGCNISNLIIDASVINEYDIVNYPTSTGSIIGRCEGDTKINNCILKGTVKGGNGYMSTTGGILGVNFGTIVQSCSVSGIVNGGIAMKVDGENYGGSTYTGGIVGYNCGDMIDCTVSGTINGGAGTMVHTGGIVAINFNHINSCTVTASALINGGETGSQNYTGGIAGFNYYRSYVPPVPAKITNCTNHANVSGLFYVGGLAGCNSGEIHTSMNTGNVFSKENLSGGLVSWNDFADYVQVYSCCTNLGSVDGQAANAENQINSGKAVVQCPDGHTKR